MKKEMIAPFNPQDAEVRANVQRIIDAAPVKNLTEDEVLQTLRLVQLERLLRDDKRTSRFAVTVYQDDQRLMACSDEDKFLALLLDADCRKTLLMSKRCRYCFGQTPYYWRKIASQCVLVAVSSNMVDADNGGRYYGRGWVLAPNIVTLRRWIEENMKEV